MFMAQNSGNENLLINPGINDSGELAKIEEIKVEFEEASSDSSIGSVEEDEPNKDRLQVNAKSPARGPKQLESSGNDDSQLNYQELIHELSFDLFSFLSAKTSFNFAEEEG